LLKGKARMKEKEITETLNGPKSCSNDEF